MSDADLEAELSARRAARARERERYTRAMRSEKLSVLETELTRLRSEISRLDTSTPLGGGTPPNAKWESLPQTRRSSQNASTGLGSKSGSTLSRAPPGTPGPSGPSAPPPPPGAPPPMGEEDEPIDPEKQRREKEERQRRREAKRKEREAAKRPMTLADIIRSAGPDPMRKLKPSGSTQLPDVNTLANAIAETDSKETFGLLRDSLKKAEKIVDEKREKRERDGGTGKDSGINGSKATNDSAGRESERNGNMNSSKDANPNLGKGTGDNTDKRIVTGERAGSEKDTKQNAESKELAEGNGEKPENGKVDQTEAKQRKEGSEIKSKNGEVANSSAHVEDIQSVSRGGDPEIVKDLPDNKELEQEGLITKSNEIEAAQPSSPAVAAEESLAVAKSSEETVSNANESDKKNKGSASDAIPAISALASKLPDNLANSTAAKRTTARKSLEERRRLRRASSGTKSINSDKSRDEKSAELADTLAAVNALKLS